MSTMENMTFAVRTELADAVRGKIADGTYADMNAFIEAALLAGEIEQDDHAYFEDSDYIRREVHAAMEEFDRDPSTGLTIEQVLANLRADRVADEATR